MTFLLPYLSYTEARVRGDVVAPGCASGLVFDAFPTFSMGEYGLRDAVLAILQRLR